MYRAIIVDDEPFMLEGMRLMIDWAACGFELCGEATGAQQALHLVDTLRPHLLITDVKMPGMLGTDLAAIISHYHPEVIILFFSVFKDFAYAQAAIRSHAFGYLTKPIDSDEVHAALHRVCQELDTRAKPLDEPNSILHDQVLRRMAQGDTSAETLMRSAILLGVKGEDPFYCAVLTHESGTLPDQALLLLSTCGGRPFQLSPSQFGIGFQQFEHHLSALHRLLDSLPDASHYTLSVGHVYKGAAGIAKSLHEALDAQGVLFEMQGMLRLYHPFDSSTAQWLSMAGLQALMETLLQGNPAALQTCIQNLRALAADHSPTLFALRYTATVLDAMLSAELDSDITSHLRPLWHSPYQEREQWLDDFNKVLLHLCANIQQLTSTALPPPVQAALSIIRTRYAEPLSVTEIARELHMNPAYLGQLIRRYTGVTFHQRLQQMRIEQACLLLRQTVKPVSEIAFAVGFRDGDYFSQQFRGKMGMTPVAYRGASEIGELL